MDREKVIKGLYAHGYRDCKSCPYWGTGDNGMSDCLQLAREAYALLKEQNNCENCAIAIEDRQPIIRCKYCKYLNASTNGVPFCKRIKKFVDADWFCADGKRW